MTCMLVWYFRFFLQTQTVQEALQRTLQFYRQQEIRWEPGVCFCLSLHSLTVCPLSFSQCPYHSFSPLCLYFVSLSITHVHTCSVSVSPSLSRLPLILPAPCSLSWHSETDTEKDTLHLHLMSPLSLSLSLFLLLTVPSCKNSKIMLIRFSKRTTSVKSGPKAQTDILGNIIVTHSIPTVQINLKANNIPSVGKYTYM